MAAPIRMTFCKLNFCKKFPASRKIEGILLQTKPKCSYSTLAEEPNEVDVDIEEEINKLRDVSNLSPRMKAKMKGKTFNMDELRTNQQFDRKYYRKMYAKYGKSSGIDPSIIWPSTEELERMVDIEKNWTASFDDLMSKVREKKDAEEKENREREIRVEKAMQKMPKLIEEFKEQGKKAGKTKAESLDEQEEIREQFIEYFGYAPGDKKHSAFAKFVMYKKFELDRQKKQSKKEIKQAKKQKTPVENKAITEGDNAKVNQESEQ